MSHLNRIAVNPNQCGGRPCIRGLRIRVKPIFYTLLQKPLVFQLVARLDLA